MKQKQLMMASLMLATISVVGGCTKDNGSGQELPIQVESTAEVIHYSVDGQTMSQCIFSDEDLARLYTNLLGMVRGGHEIIIGDNGERPVTCKEVVTFDTANEKEAADWADKRRREGFVVRMTYDEKEGLFRCIAYR